jgi:hypothetical protein
VPVTGVQQFIGGRVEVVETKITVEHHDRRGQMVEQTGVEFLELLLVDH